MYHRARRRKIGVVAVVFVLGEFDESYDFDNDGCINLDLYAYRHCHCLPLSVTNLNIVLKKEAFYQPKPSSHM